jgi:hypothetical protein
MNADEHRYFRWGLFNVFLLLPAAMLPQKLDHLTVTVPASKRQGSTSPAVSHIHPRAVIEEFSNDFYPVSFNCVH